MTHKEIGEARQIHDTLVHVRGKPLEEAYFIESLMKTQNKETNEPYKQSEVAKLMGLTQGQISRRLALLNLIPKLQDMLKEGKMKPRTAYILSKLPKEEQAHMAAETYITMEMAEAKRRGMVISEDVMTLLETPIPIIDEDCDHEFVCIHCGKKLAKEKF